MLDDVNTLDEAAASLLIKPTEPKAEKPVEKIEAKEESVNEAVTEEPAESNEGEDAANEAEASVEEDTPEENPEEEVDIDDIEIDVVVDGQESKVKLRELKANYSGEKVIEKRIQEASEARNYAVHYGQHLYGTLETQAQKLKQLDSILERVVEPEINWEELKKNNLPRYLLERDRQREAQEKRAVLSQEQQRIAYEQQQLMNTAMETYASDQAKALVSRVPEFANPETAPKIMQSLTKAAAAYGYSPEEFSAVMDHRAVLVLRDAMLYQEMVGKRKEVKPVAATTTLLRPSPSKAAVSKATQAKKLQDALIRKAKTSGNVDDVAATLLMRTKK